MSGLILVLALAWLGCLLAEARQVAKARGQIVHVVHVNGTRGKSTVCRMIEAGLRAGGLRVFCKTTGTDPMTIDVEGREEPIRRRGRANIKEQVAILRRAAAQEAQVLVVECMAVQPEFQRAAQRDILKADIGVITNVRRDHTDVMGETLPQICDALCETIPEYGTLFTAEEGQLARMTARAGRLNCKIHPVRPRGDEPALDFAENTALALAVCQYLGVDRNIALRGMEHFRRDPYALSLYRLGQGVFVNGLSVNDVQSTCMVWSVIEEQYGLEGRELILLVNNRPDRGSRTVDMLSVCLELKPAQVWLMGAAQVYMKHGLEGRLPECRVRRVRSLKEIASGALGENQVVFAVGNVANGGRELMAWVREEGTPFV